MKIWVVLIKMINWDKYYSIKACGRKCYVYIAYFSIDVAITNFYILHSHLSETSFHYMKDFRLNLATKLISSYNSWRHAGCLSISPVKNFARVTSHRNQTTNVTDVITAIRIKKIRKDTQWCCQDCSINVCHTS